MKKYRHAVSALVLRPTDVCLPGGECKTIHQVLLVHKPRIRDAWQLPQGGVEQGETIEQAAVRELEEEVGLRFDAVHHVSEATYCYDFPKSFVERYKPANAGQKLCFVTFLAGPSAQIKVDHREIDNFAWILSEQLPLYIKRTEYLEIVREVVNESESKLKA